MLKLVCWKCGASLDDVPRPITRHSNCLSCYAELYCCRMCRKYDSRYTSKCSDDRTDPPSHKDTANFCDYYSPDFEAFRAGELAAAKSSEAKLDALFGGENPDENDEGKSAAGDDDRAEFDALFKSGEDN